MDKKGRRCGLDKLDTLIVGGLLENDATTNIEMQKMNTTSCLFDFLSA